MGGSSSYLRSTRHPWACLLFILPLLLAYELGVLMLGGPNGETPRTGADAWVRIAFQRVGLHAVFWPPAVILGFFLVWNWFRWHDRPKDSFGVWLGMAVESAAFALTLWGLWQVQTAILEHQEILLATSPTYNRRIATVVSFLGAGIYEEFIFRLLLFALLLRFMHYTDVGGWTGLASAAALSGLIFSLAHHVGPYGEEFNGAVFLFRSIAGVYFALVFHYRGFGVAAGAHAGYDVLVGAALA